MAIASAHEQASPNSSEKIRVMLVDDSAVVRGLLGRWLSAEDNIEVVSRCHNGAQAVREVGRLQPTLIILDIEMPEMDGLEALPLLLEASPKSRVLIASGLSQVNAKISLTALSKGAHDYIPKPTSNSGLTTSNEFRVDLITRVNALCVGMGGRKKLTIERAQPRVGDPVSAHPTKPPLNRSATSKLGATSSSISSSLASERASSPSSSSNGDRTAKLLPYKTCHPEVICIGSSTGGPRALQTLLTNLLPNLQKVAVVITQHMPKSFTTVFAEHLDRSLPVPVKEVTHGDEVRPGTIYVAPGDYHIVFEKSGGVLRLCLDDGPPVNFCKPAVDCMFQSAGKVLGNKTLGVILTGMGQDGVRGGRSLVEAGANIFAQDEASSIVWGMPGAAYKAGICSGVFSIDEMANKIDRALKGGRL